MYSIHILLYILYLYLDDHTFVREGCIISQCSVKTWTFWNVTNRINWNVYTIPS